MNFYPVPSDKTYYDGVAVRKRSGDGELGCLVKADRCWCSECKRVSASCPAMGLRVPFARAEDALRNQESVDRRHFILPIGAQGWRTTIGGFVPSNFRFRKRASAGAVVTAGATGARALFWAGMAVHRWCGSLRS